MAIHDSRFTPRLRSGQAIRDYAAVWLIVALFMAGEPITLAASDYFGQVTFKGLPVPGASVVVTQGGKTRAATTNEDGIYHLADLVDGVWKITIEMLGFATVERESRCPQIRSRLHRR